MTATRYGSIASSPDVQMCWQVVRRYIRPARRPFRPLLAAFAVPPGTRLVDVAPAEPTRAVADPMSHVRRNAVIALAVRPLGCT